MKRQVASWVVGAGLLVNASAGYGFALGDHKQIVLQAVAEFNKCYGDLIDPSQEFVLWTSDLDEDTNVVRKDLAYSHFFNPYKKLKMFRYDSSVRVADLQDNLLRDIFSLVPDNLQRFDDLGHAIHHLQDASTPLHTVPVNHYFNDGFESFTFNGDISSGWSCADMGSQPLLDLNTRLVVTAKQTLKNQNFGDLLISKRDAQGWVEPLKINGDAFWQDSGDDNFGQYGFLGNHYGQEVFTQDGNEFTIPMDFYKSYKQQQLKLAVQATLQAFRWYYLQSR